MRSTRFRSGRHATAWLVGALAAGWLASVPAEDIRAGLVADGVSPQLILGYTGDVIGFIEPCG